jgi:hypothetical protein
MVLNAALALEPARMVAGPANGADAQPLGGDRVHLTVAVAGDQHLHPVLALEERCQEMLAVPQGDDRRLLRLGALIEIRGLDDKAARLPHQPQVLGGQGSDCSLHPGPVLDPPGPRHRRAPLSQPYSSTLSLEHVSHGRMPPQGYQIATITATETISRPAEIRGPRG